MTRMTSSYSRKSCLQYVLLPALLLAVAGCSGGATRIEDASRTAHSQAEKTALVIANAWPQADTLFHRDVRWLGGDAAYSVRLDGERTLWLFGDSFISVGEAGGRESSVMVRNSVALQTGGDPSSASMAFYWRRDEEGKPASFFPEQDRTWFWPADGVQVEGQLTLFLYRVEPDGSPGSLGFELSGWTAVRVEQPDADPLQWRMRPLDVPGAGAGVVVGAAVVREQGHVLAYAVRRTTGHEVLALRWADTAFKKGDLSHPKWWRGADRGWGTGEPEAVMTRGETEFSVSRLDGSSLWLQVQSRPFAGGEIGVRYAPAPTGPWSDICTIYHPPEADRKELLVYAGKAHPELEGADLIATYVANTVDPGLLVRDTGIYFPRFVRMSEQQLVRACPPPRPMGKR
jgi:hypothetical protein